MKTGELKNIGTHRLGMTTYEYYQCVDCKTDYPVIRGFPSCNGAHISKCPYCKPRPKLPE